jgi:hypothetical protein
LPLSSGDLVVIGVDVLFTHDRSPPGEVSAEISK